MQKLSSYHGFLRAALSEDANRLKREAQFLGISPDLVVDRINEVAADGLGDVLLEENENGIWSVFEDYRTLVQQMTEGTSPCREED